MNTEHLILVDENDQEWGNLEKMLVHKLGFLHRAFSIFIFNEKGELLLQQRADEKYHSPGLWTNTCCSHPRFKEDLKTAVPRRLMEEMRMTCKTSHQFHFIYKAKFENGLTEHEYDHVFFGLSNELPKPDKSEVKSWKYMSLHDLQQDIKLHPENYTVWLQTCIEKVKNHLAEFLLTNSVIEKHEHVSL